MVGLNLETPQAAVLALVAVLTAGCGSPPPPASRPFGFVMSREAAAPSICPEPDGLSCAGWRPDERERRSRLDDGYRLLQGRRWDAAVRFFENRFHDRPNTETASDLAVALALRSREKDDPVGILEALELLASPRWSESVLVRFNRAVLAKDLGLLHVSRLEFQRLLAFAPVASERFSVPIHLGDIDEGAQFSNAPLARNALLSPSAARDEILRFLVPNLNGAVDGNTAPKAEDSLARWEVLASVYPEAGFSDWLRLFREIEEGRRSVSSLSAGYLDYKQGRYQDALSKLSILVTFEPESSSVYPWACTYLTLVAHTLEDMTNGEAERCQRLVRAQGPAEAVGRVNWSDGINLARGGRYVAAMERFVETERAFQAAGDRLRVADALYLQSDLLRLLGSVGEGWRIRWRALRLYVDFAPSYFQHALLWDAALAARDWPAAAELLHLEDELVVAFIDSDLARFEAPFYHAQSLLELGRVERAAELHDEALARLPDAPENPVWRRAKMLASLQRAQISVARRADDAVAVSRHALETVEARRDQIWRGQALTTLARANAVLGDPDAAREHLESSIRHFEGLLATVAGSRFRAEFLEDAQSTMDLLIDWALEADDPEGAVRGLERARALEPTAFSTASGAEISGAPTVGGAKIAIYGLTAHRLAVFTLTKDGLRLVLVSPEVEEIRRTATRLARHLAESSDPALAAREAADLYRLLIEPLNLADGEPVILVPDRFLVNLPFLALYNPSSAHYLGEERAVLVSPSLSYALNERTAPRRRGDPLTEKALVVANSRDPSGRLPTLPGVLQEANLVAEAYGPEAVLLADDAATSDRVLAELPRAAVAHFAMHTRTWTDDPWSTDLVTAEPDGKLLSRLGRLDHLELASLSACSTALSSDSRGRVLTGLSRELLQRGTHRVLGALWPIEDLRALEFQRRFHRHFAATRKPETAVRLTIVDMVQDGLGPEYWGMLQLIG